MHSNPLLFNMEDNCIVFQIVQIVLLLLCFQELLRRWMSLQHHITGVHRWEDNGTEYRCFHKDLSAQEQRSKMWLQENSPAFKALMSMVMDTRLIKDLQQMTLFKHTGMCIKEFDMQNSDMVQVMGVSVRIGSGKLYWGNVTPDKTALLCIPVMTQC